jgi:hypothetical protein
MRGARLLLPDETSRLLRLDRGALAIELDEQEQLAGDRSSAWWLLHKGGSVRRD